MPGVRGRQTVIKTKYRVVKKRFQTVKNLNLDRNPVIPNMKIMPAISQTPHKANRARNLNRPSWVPHKTLSISFGSVDTSGDFKVCLVFGKIENGDSVVEIEVEFASGEI